MLCGTDPFPEFFRAKKYKIHDKYLTKNDFKFLMNNLPIPVSLVFKRKLIIYYINEENNASCTATSVR
jgi:hypothetical protein